MPDLNDALQVEIDALKARLAIVIARAERAEAQVARLTTCRNQLEGRDLVCRHCQNAAELEAADE